MTNKSGPVRKVRSSGRNLNFRFTNKVNRAIQCESYQEYRLAITFERNPTVCDYQHQPETFTYLDEGDNIRRYTPDFKVWRDDGTIEIHEVTLESRRSKHLMREQAGGRICQERGWTYTVHTDATLPSEVHTDNLVLLMGYRSTMVHDPAIAYFVRDLLEARPLALDSLVSQVAKEFERTQGDVLPAIYHLLWHQRLEAALDMPLWERGNLSSRVIVRRMENN